MTMTDDRIHRDSPAWRRFVQLSFAIALGSLLLGIAYLPASLWIYGYLAMGTLFVTGSTFPLARTMRDEHEARKLLHRQNESETARLLRTGHDDKR